MFNSNDHTSDASKSKEELIRELADLRTQLVFKEKAEQSLRENQINFQLAAKAAKMGFYSRNLETGEDHWSPEFLYIFGLNPDEPLPIKDGIPAAVHPEDREAVLKEANDRLFRKTDSEFISEHRIIRPNGEIRWVMIRGIFGFDANGRPIRAHGFAIDITDRKMAEISLLQSEERYRQLFEDDLTGNFVASPDGRILLCNPAFAEIYGFFSPEECIGFNFRNLKAKPENWKFLLYQLKQSRIVKHFESIHRRPNGTVIDIVENVVGVFDDQGELTQIRGYIFENTERKKAENALRESEERFRALVTASSEVLYRMNPDWSEMRQLHSHGFLAKTEKPNSNWLEEYIPLEDQPHVKAVINEAIRTKSIFALEHRVNREDGTVGWTISRAIPILNENGKIDEWFGAANDITDRKNAEISLRQLNETLESQVAERTAVAQARSKQLQRLAVDLIEAEEKERQRIAKLLHDDMQQLLAGARLQLQAARNKSNPAPLLNNVEMLLGESIEKSRHLSHELSPPVLYHAGLDTALEWLVRKMDEQFGLKVQFTAEGVAQVDNSSLKIFLFRAVQELLFNTVKHADVKNAQAAVSGSADNIRIIVSDPGRGFNPADLYTDGKSGLGLASLRERVHAIGGNMDIESAPGQGSRFTLMVPIALPEAAKLKISVSANELQTPIKAGVSDLTKGDKIRVLFADDHKVLRKGLIGLVAGKPDISVVGEAADGVEALELTRQLLPDVVVMDIDMPRMDGIEATRRIKAALPEVRVIGLSTMKGEEIVRKMKDAGAEAFVTKMGSSAELIKAIYGMKPGRK